MGDLQTLLLSSSIPAGECSTCPQEIYLWLGHIYNLLSPSSRNNTAVWLEMDNLLRPSATLVFLAMPRVWYPAFSPRHCILTCTKGRRQAGTAMVQVGCEAHQALWLFPNRAFTYAGGQLGL